MSAIVGIRKPIARSAVRSETSFRRAGCGSPAQRQSFVCRTKIVDAGQVLYVRFCGELKVTSSSVMRAPSTFNVPVAGALLAVEIILRESGVG